MFRWFAKKEITFKERVSRFWEWYGTVASRYAAVLDRKTPEELAEEVSAKVRELGPGFAWVFGPGAEEKGYSLTVSGEGDRHRQLLAQFWQKQAPTIPGWTFHPARQPDKIPSGVLEFSGKRFDLREVWVSPSRNNEEEKVDLAVWHPAWKLYGRA